MTTLLCIWAIGATAAACSFCAMYMSEAAYAIKMRKYAEEFQSHANKAFREWKVDLDSLEEARDEIAKLRERMINN